MSQKKQPTTPLFTLKIIFWVLRLVYRFSPTLIIPLLFVQLVATVIPFAEQKYLSYLIDSLISSIAQKTSAWTNVFIIFFFIRIFKILFLNLQRILQHLLDRRVQNELRKFYLNKISALDYQQFEDEKIANLMSKVSEEYQWRTHQVIADIFDLIIQTISFATVIILLLPHYWYLAVLLFVGELPTLFVDQKWQKIDWRTFNHYNEKSRPGWDAAWQLTDKRFIAELKINRAVEWLKSKFTLIHDEFTLARIKNRKDKFLPDLLTSTFSLSMAGFCMLFIIKDINRGLLSIGMFTFYFGITRGTGDYFAGVLNRFVSIGEQALHIDNFRTIIQLPKAISDGHLKTGIANTPTIEFKNVSFKYPNSKRYIYRHLNLKISPKEEIAIVGPNGAGKSTLIKLICRFYDPTEGQILINNIDLRQYDLDYWYQHLSLLTQEFNIYPNLNLRENISISQDANDQRVTLALKKSEAFDFVHRYRNGLDTMMSQKYGGEEPSWGQWQRIAIARIFYHNSSIMILDEPTASIDAISEAKIFSRLYRQVKKQTLIIISHRFSTVRNAHRIIVINRGKIIEEGNHDQLIRHNGLYAKSFKLQARGYSSTPSRSAPPKSAPNKGQV